MPTPTAADLALDVLEDGFGQLGCEANMTVWALDFALGAAKTLAAAGVGAPSAPGSQALDLGYEPLHGSWNEEAASAFSKSPPKAETLNFSGFILSFT